MNAFEELINKKLLVITLLILIFNIYFVDSSDIMGLASMIEFLILFLAILIKGCKQFLLLLLLFTSISFDVPEFVGSSSDSLYSVSNLPFLGFLGLFGLIILAFILFLTSGNMKLKIKNTGLFKLLKFSMYIIFIGIFMSLVSSLLNDNMIPLDSFIFFFKNDFAKYFTISTIIILYILQINSDNHFYVELKQYLSTILIAIVLAAPISVLSGYIGFYGDSETILMPLPFFFSTCMILFLFDKKYKKYKALLLIVSFIAIYLQFFFPNSLGGKSWLVLIFILYFLFARYVKMSFKIPFVIIITIIIILSGFSINNQGAIDPDANLLDKKLNEAMSILAFSQMNYYENISDSPKARVDEFINVVDEFKEKPLFSIFGKGFGGSVKDHNNYFGSFQASYFSDREYINNSFVFLHESINVIFLKFGMIGIFLFFLLIVKISKNGFSNPWLSIGFIWFIFFFGYTISLGIFGVSSLVLGLYEANIFKENMNLKETVCQN
jgi:hypothetical protein